MADRADLVIIGGGPGGYAAALYGAAAGLDVAMIENQKVGGTCLHRGCIPAKALLETASVRRALAGAAEFGFTVDEPTMDFGVSQDRSQGVIDKLHSGLSSLLGSRKVRVVNGTGRLLGAGRVAVSGGEDGDLELEGDAVLLASGSVPRTIPGFDVQGDLVVTSDELLKQRELPASAVVIGGGAIGCEFASMMSDLGTEVTILEALPKILPGLDADVAKVVERSFKKRGITIHTGVDVTGHEPGGAGTTVRFGEDQSIEVEQVVVSVGRRPLSDVLGLEGTGVEVDERGFVKVDAQLPHDPRRGLGRGRPHPHRPAGPRGLRRGDRRRQGHPGRGRRAGRLRPGPVVHLLPSRGGVRRALRGELPRRRATTWSPSSTASAATGGP